MKSLFSKKSFIHYALIGILALGILTGCGINNSREKNDNNSINTNRDEVEAKIMEDFQAKLANEVSLSEIVKFIEENISQLSKENAVLMVDELEKMQKDFLSQLEERFFAGDGIQQKISRIYNVRFDLSEVEKTEDPELKKLLKETRDNGYKLETAEGTFFPVIDYEFYKRFNPYLTPDYKEYIELMAVESNRMPAKDAALVIDWKEVLERAVNQEQFIIKYGDSKKIEQVKGLYKKYLTFALFGANNTPLFSYDSKTMDPEAREIYSIYLNEDNNSKLKQNIRGFMNLVEKNNYKLTAEVEEYRKNILENLK